VDFPHSHSGLIIPILGEACERAFRQECPARDSFFAAATILVLQPLVVEAIETRQRGEEMSPSRRKRYKSSANVPRSTNKLFARNPCNGMARLDAFDKIPEDSRETIRESSLPYPYFRGAFRRSRIGRTTLSRYVIVPRKKIQMAGRWISDENSFIPRPMRPSRHVWLA
jgi:hypothetical protein